MNEKDLKQTLHGFSPRGLTADDLQEMHGVVQLKINQLSRATASVRRRPKGRPMVGGAAAAVAGVLIVGGGVFYAADKNAVQTKTPPTPATTAINKQHPPVVAALRSSVELNGIQMFSDHMGWMLGAGGQLLHTVDGAATWIDVSPVSQGDGQMQTTTVQGGKNAWVAIGALTGQHATTVVYRTDNGGQSWTHQTFSSSSSVPSAGVEPAYLTFLNTKQGWMVTQIPDFGMGGTTPGPLYETTDGGVTWREVSRRVANNIVSFAWVNFTSSKVGFTVGAHQNMQADTGATDGNPERLYMTRDGGSTWQSVHVNLPTSGYLSILRPTFFSRQSGVLPVVVRSQSQGDTFVTYTTSDGGQTWSEQGSQTLPSPVTGVDFISAKEGYLLSGRVLYRTVDAGCHWRQCGTLPGVFQTSSATVDFADAQHGWVYPQTLQVYHTTDAGKTWTTMTATATKRH